MRAAYECGKIAIFSGDSHPNVAGLVGADFELEFLADLFEVFKDLCFDRTVTLSGNAGGVFGHGSNIVKAFLSKRKRLFLEVSCHRFSWCEY